MGFFTVGNIITLGIVLLILILYRQMDRNNRALKLIRDYSEKLKKDLGDFVKEQERAIKDYAISLNVERDSAKELMKRLQQTEEELAEKAGAMARIDSQLKAYEDSLAELENMTGRVQENMNRVREESAFVDSTGKRISEVKDKLTDFEKALGEAERKLEKGMGDAERKLEKTLGDAEKKLEKSLGDTGKKIDQELGDAGRRIQKELGDAVSKIEKELGDAESKIERELGDAESKFEKESSEYLEKTADEVLATVKATVSDLKATEEVIERKVEDHRLAVVKIEEARAANLARDTDYIDKLLAKAVDQAGKRADKMEEAALAKLKEQAEDRIHKFKAAEEERLRTYQESAKAKVVEVQNLFKNFRDEWRSERSEWESKDKIIRDERKKDLDIFAVKFDASKKQIDEFNARANDIISSQKALLLKTAEEMKQQVLETNGAKLEEYRRAQDLEFRRLEALIDDSRNLDAELRHYIQELIERFKDEFSAYQGEAEELRKAETENFSLAAAHFKGGMAELEKELEALRDASYDNNSEKLKSFENEFYADLNKLNNDINLRITEWQGGLEGRLSAIGENSETALRESEHNRTEEMKKSLSAMDARFASGLERLQSAADAFEKGILDRIKTVEEMERKALEASGAKLEEYRRAQDIEFQRLETLADDSRKLDAELRHYIQELIERLKDEFTAYQGEAEELRKAETENFSLAAAQFKGGMAELEKELNAMRDASHENISEKLKALEDEFITGIKKRNNDINLQVAKWQSGIDGRLSAIGENSETTLRQLENSRTEEMKKSLVILNTHLVSELERLKSEAGVFEKGILDQMKTAEVMKQKALDEYRLAQDTEFTRLKALADDSEKKDAELRRYMQEAISQWKDEFSAYQGEAEKLRKEETENFSLATAHFKGGMAELEKGLEELRAASYDNISEKLKTFEKEFLTDLNKKNNDIDLRITEWQGGLEGRLSTIGENSETALRESERSRADEMKKNLAALDAYLASELERLKSETAAFEKEILDQIKAAEEMERQALEANDVRLEEYRRAQDIEFRRLETLADDARKLDAELRLYVQELIGRLKDEFSGYQGEAEELRKAETDNFTLTTAHLKDGMAGLEKGLEELRTASYESISEKLRTFENEFLTDINKRSNDMNLQIAEWQNVIEGRLSVIGENSVTALRELEQSRAEEMKKNLSALDARLVSELEHLKSETGAFEGGILDQMKAADDSVLSFREQLDRGLEETRKEAELSIKAEIGNYSLTAAETVKKYQRELDDAWNGLSVRLRELDENVEEARQRIRDLAAETDSRIASVRTSVDDAERHIRDAVDQTKLIDKADAMRLEMERRIEDLKSDIDRLDQRRAEAARIENEFIKIKRIEDDINSKMIKIFSEERRVENMEANFTRFLQISRSVEDKLTEVTASDDTLQAVQLKIRKLEEALGGTEEKFQRIEKKNQILDNTNDSIDKNFKALQDSEKLSDRIGGELVQYADELEKIKVSIEKLSAESEKAASAVDRIDVLDKDLEEIEERIKSMQRVRQWIAEAETRLEELNRQAQTQARAIDAMVKGKKSGPAPDLGEGAPSQQKKENIIILARQGWTVDEIAKNLKISRGEVELTLEFAPKD